MCGHWKIITAFNKIRIIFMKSISSKNVGPIHHCMLVGNYVGLMYQTIFVMMK